MKTLRVNQIDPEDLTTRTDENESFAHCVCSLSLLLRVLELCVSGLRSCLRCIHLLTWRLPNTSIAPWRKIRLCDSVCARNETYSKQSINKDFLFSWGFCCYSIFSIYHIMLLNCSHSATVHIIAANIIPPGRRTLSTNKYAWLL